MAKIKISWRSGRGGRKEEGTDEIKVKCNKNSQDQINAAVHTWKRKPENRTKVVTQVKVC